MDNGNFNITLIDNSNLLITTKSKAVRQVIKSLLSFKFSKDMGGYIIDIVSAFELYLKLGNLDIPTSRALLLEFVPQDNDLQPVKYILCDKLTYIYNVPMSLASELAKLDSTSYIGSHTWFLRTLELENLIPKLEATGKTEFIEGVNDLLNRRYEYDKSLILPEPDYDKLVRPPFNHQKESIRYLCENRKCILGDDRGLGKTYTMCVVANQILNKYDRGIVLMVCPNNAKYNLACTMYEINSNVPICIASSKFISPERVIIINYDILYKYMDTLLSMEIIALFFDEAHKLSAVDDRGLPKTQRAMVAKLLANKTPYVYLATGTPMKDKTLDLYNLMDIVDSKETFGFIRFGLAYCGGKQTKGGWDFKGSSNQTVLHKKLNDVMVRHLKKDVLDLPPVFRTLMPVDADLKEYDRNLNMFIANRETNRAHALVLIGAMKKYIAYAKINSTINIVEDIIEERGRVIVFTEYLKVVDEIMKHFGDICAKITGAENDEQKREIETRFTNGEYKVLVLTIKAGGESLNLQVADTSIYNDLPWSSTQQSDDRINRIGQKNTMNIIYTIANGAEMDEKLIKLLELKAKNMDAIVDGVGTTFRVDIMKSMYASLGNKGIKVLYEDSDRVDDLDEIINKEYVPEKKEPRNAIMNLVTSPSNIICNFYFNDDSRGTGEYVGFNYTTQGVGYMYGIYQIGANNVKPVEIELSDLETKFICFEEFNEALDTYRSFSKTNLYNKKLEKMYNKYKNMYCYNIQSKC